MKLTCLSTSDSHFVFFSPNQSILCNFQIFFMISMSVSTDRYQDSSEIFHVSILFIKLTWRFCSFTSSSHFVFSSFPNQSIFRCFLIFFLLRLFFPNRSFGLRTYDFASVCPKGRRNDRSADRSLVAWYVNGRRVSRPSLMRSPNYA